METAFYQKNITLIKQTRQKNNQQQQQQKTKQLKKNNYYKTNQLGEIYNTYK